MRLPVLSVALVLLALSAHAQAPTDLAVTISCPATAIQGASFPCQLVAHNNGPDAAQSVRAIVDFNNDRTWMLGYTSSTTPRLACFPTGLGTSPFFECDVTTLAANGTATADLTIATDPSFFIGDTVKLTPRVSMANPDTNPSNNVAGSTLIDRSSSDVQLTMTAPATAPAGTDVTLTIKVLAAGPSDALNTVVKYDLPPGTAFVSASVDDRQEAPTLTCTTPTAGSGGSVQCSGHLIAPIPAFQFPALDETVTVTIRLPITGGTFVNTASANSTIPDPVSSNNTASATIVANANPDSADMSIVKSADVLSAVSGTPVTYSLLVRNAGPAIARAVVITDDLPAGMTLVSSSVPCSGSPLTCPLGDLAPGASTTVRLIASAPSSAGDTTNTARVASNTADALPANNTSSVRVSIVPANEADLFVQGSFATPAVRDFAAGLGFAFVNRGPAVATNVRFTISMPAGTTLHRFDAGNLTCSTPPIHSAGPISCAVSSLSTVGGASIDLEIDVPRTIPIDTMLVANASISSDTPDSHSSDNTATATSTPVQASTDLSASLAPNPTTVAPGADVTWTAIVTNRGPDAARNLTVSSTLPTVPSAITSGVAVCRNGLPVVCTLPTLTAGSQLTISMATKAPDKTGFYAPSLRVTSDAYDTSSGNDRGETTLKVAVPTAADVAVSIDAPPTAPAGSDVTLRLHLRNHGPNDAATVRVAGALPARAAFVSIRQESGPAFVCLATNDLVCTATSFPASASADFAIVFGTEASPSILWWSAAVTSTTADPSLQNNAANATVDVGGHAARRRAAHH
jgi:uncharacterized repeat protein (TIGR01451 family)